MALTLVESVGKKAMFCEHIVRLLGLEGVEVIKGRAEDVGCMPAHRERYDWSVARAVAEMRVLAEYLLPLVHVGGTALALKGESGPAESQAADKAMRMLGGQLNQIIPVDLPGLPDDRYLVLIGKKAATPPKYPRKAGMPMKHPL
jgi:16S rRNA (guanine527-N7)-methyltransferase